MVTSFDPRTASSVEEVAAASSSDEVAALGERAVAAASALDAMGRAGRAAMLRKMADALEERRDDLVAIADRESALGPARLGGELTRTTFQLRFFAEVLEDGAYLEIAIDHAGTTPMGPRPDLRRMLRPLGPVAVFGASNFPFAFSVPGGDTASALAAGCPVIVKAHEAHPATSLVCAQALAEGARRSGAPEGVVQLVFGQAAGAVLVEEPRIQAVGFTGSVAGGRALYDLATGRPSPIPFYGELGALNALVVCPAAAADRPAEIATGLAGSFTLGVGQFCTKPGLALVPEGASGDALLQLLAEDVRARVSAVMLSERVAAAFHKTSVDIAGAPGVRRLAEGIGAEVNEGWWGTPLLLEVDPDELSGPLLEECFGPVLVAARYRSARQLLELLDRAGPALTASIHADPADDQLAEELVGALVTKVGRIVWNAYPTGVAVSWAMHHGGPWPATTDALHTSVGASAIRRWLRPVAYQDVPERLLPPELVDDPLAAHRVPRRVDGQFVLP
ncbi:MAG: Aldehyde Dehydrogenase [Acidimicrobiaceae bacterium]|nr:Aldehyde Dehydrogenase [Acidimicrobiaceae bacterium]